MRVTHVVRQFHPAIGGFETAVLNLAKLERSRWGIDTRIVTLDRLFTKPDETLPATEILEDLDLIVQRIPWRGSSRYPVAPSVLRAIETSDIVHVHAIDFFFDYLAITYPLHRKRLIASTHGGFFHTQKWAPLKRVWFQTVTRASAKAYEAVIAVSESDAKTFAPVVGNKLVHIETGVNLDKFKPRTDPRRETRRIVTFGRMTRHKRLDRLVALLAALLRREPGWELVIVGPEGDHPVDEILAPAVQTGNASSVRIRGALSETELADEVAQASWFGSTSAFEGFGLAAVEAAAAGLIPVLSDIRPFAKLHAALGVGILFAADHPDQAAAQMVELAVKLPSNRPNIQARLAAGIAPYGIATAAEAHAALYEKVMSRGR